MTPPGVTIYKPRSKTRWHAARSQCITASVAGALLGISPYTTLYQLWAEKSGRMPRDSAENDAMRKGRVLEPAAIELAREDHPDWNITYKRDNAFYSDILLRIGCTPDAFAFRPDKEGLGIVQVKIVSEEVLANEWTDDDGNIVPPDWIMVQAIIEAKLTGADWGSVYVMAVGRGIKGQMIDVPLHDGVWNAIVAETAKFWLLVDSGHEPTPEWEKDAHAIGQVYRRSKPAEVEIDDEDLDKATELFSLVRLDRLTAERNEEVLKGKLLFGIKENEVVLTRRYRISAPSSVNAAGNFTRRITIKERNN